MSYRDSKRSTVPPPRARRRTTRRGIVPMSAIEDIDGNEPTAIGSIPLPDINEDAYSTRATRRDLQAVQFPTPQKRTPRGEYSVSSMRGIAADVISGSIEPTQIAVAPPPRRRRSTSVPAENVHLAQATKKEITVIIGDQALTLQRTDALALAQIILTTFG